VRENHHCKNRSHSLYKVQLFKQKIKSLNYHAPLDKKKGLIY